MDNAVLFSQVPVENIWLILIPVFAALVAFSFFMMLVSRYKRCPCNRVLVIFGKVGGPGLAPLAVPREFWTWPGSPRDPGLGDPLVTFRYDQAFEFVDAIRNQRPCVPSFP